MKTRIVLSSLLLALVASTTYAQRPAEPAMIMVEGGSFNMGSNLDEDTKPIHRVTVSGFKMGKYPVTVAAYRVFCEATGRDMPDAPPWGWIADHPMTLVSWADATAYCDWLTDKTGTLYRLPTEAEWEYAARGGKKSKNVAYSGDNKLEAVGWFDADGNGTKPVGQKAPNELGLYDMSGNVFEWCADWYDPEYYANSPDTDPRGPLNGQSRVMRGGSWLTPAPFARVSYRYNVRPNLPHRINGFRVVSPL